MLRRIALLLWCLVSLAIAAQATLSMFISFAPSSRLARDLGMIEHRSLIASSELSGIERARNVWAGPVFAASGLLVINSIALVVQSWGCPWRLTDEPKKERT